MEQWTVEQNVTAAEVKGDLVRFHLWSVGGRGGKVKNLSESTHLLKIAKQAPSMTEMDIKWTFCTLAYRFLPIFTSPLDPSAHLQRPQLLTRTKVSSLIVG